jgi:hypothetical protein
MGEKLRCHADKSFGKDSFSVREYSVEVFRGRKGKMFRTHSMYVGRIRNMCNTSIGISDWKTHLMDLGIVGIIPELHWILKVKCC